MISCIIPCYNPGDWFGDVVQNKVDILDAYGEDYEIIIVDDGCVGYYSEVVKIASCISPHVRLVRQVNSGVSAARNRGVAVSRGDIIMFSDADDIWSAKKLLIDYTLFKAENLEVLGSQLRKRATNFLELGEISLFSEVVRWGPHTSSMIIKKELFLKIGGFSEHMRYAEDGDFLVRLIQKLGSFSYVNWDSVSNIEGKRVYGESGLSNNMLAMFKGELNIVLNSLDIKLYILIPYLWFKFVIRVIKKSLR